MQNNSRTVIGILVQNATDSRPHTVKTRDKLNIFARPKSPANHRIIIINRIDRTEYVDFLLTNVSFIRIELSSHIC